MKVFISWSGPFSHKVALIFRDWLPKVVQSVDPYVSSEDIDKGTRWSIDVATELSTSFYGVLCVTRENQGAPWLNFEAGALSKHLNDSNVSPFLIDMKKSEVVGPLQQFQLTVFDKVDIKKLVQSIKNADKDCRLSDQQFDDVFDMWWPKLDASLSSVVQNRANSSLPVPSVAKTQENSEVHQSSDALIEEILQLSRQQTRSLASQERVMLDFMESNTRRMHRPSERDFSHPAVQDLVLNWQSVSEFFRMNFGEAAIPGSILDAFRQMDRASEYLSRGTNRYRGSQHLFSELGLPVNDE